MSKELDLRDTIISKPKIERDTQGNMVAIVSPNPIALKRRERVDPKEYMRCPACNNLESRATNTAAATFETAKGIGRNRQCVSCGHRWRTIELKVSELDDLMEENKK